jgi:hypothetical protein
MPALIAIDWTTVHPVVPCVWQCSKCEAIFESGGRLRGMTPSVKQIGELNRQFEVHSQHVHPKSFPITGILT